MTGTLAELMIGYAERLAKQAVGPSYPNPPVGCVILDGDGRIVGYGSTAPVGGPHAEIAALAAAGDRARGGTAFSTLEPCGHFGRTGPCAAALAEAGIARAIWAVDDPAPAHSGRALLQDAGVRTYGGVNAGRVATGSLRPWLHARRTGRPYVTWKWAASLDGRVNGGPGRWISSEAARADVHRLRARCDAVMIGAGTAEADDPALTARRPDGGLAAAQPLRVVVGSRPLPDDLALRRDQDVAPTAWYERAEPAEILASLAQRGIVHVLLEGGPTLGSAVAAAGLVDQVVVYLAPALHGDGAVPYLPAVGPRHRRLRLADVATIGEDVRLTYDAAADAGAGTAGTSATTHGGGPVSLPGGDLTASLL